MKKLMLILIALFAINCENPSIERGLASLEESLAQLEASFLLLDVEKMQSDLLDMNSDEQFPSKFSLFCLVPFRKR